MVLELSGLILVLLSLDLPVLHLLSEFADILFEPAGHLLALGNLDLVVPIVVDFGVQLQFLVF